MSRLLCALSITILTFGAAPAPRQQVPQLPPTPPPPTGFGVPTDVRKPIHHLDSIACGFAPPSTIAEWWKESAGIVRVQINSHRTYDRDRELSSRPYIHTELDVTVLDVFKLHPRAAGVGGTMTITHPGGTLERPDAYYVSTTNHFPPPPLGTEWILFLYWNKDTDEFWISSLQYGAFEVVDGKVALLADSPFGALWSGKHADAFADALRTVR